MEFWRFIYSNENYMKLNIYEKENIFYDSIGLKRRQITIDEFYEMSQYFTLLRNIYIFGLKNESYYFELIPDKIEKSKEILI